MKDDWVHERCKNWGRAQYRIMYGKGGYPTRTMLGKIIDEGLVGSGAAGKFTQYCPEVLIGEDLETANAVKMLPDEERQLVTIHYVIRLPAKIKAQRIEIPIRTYYAKIRDARQMLVGVLTSFELRHTFTHVAQNSQFSCNTNP